VHIFRRARGDGLALLSGETLGQRVLEDGVGTRRFYRPVARYPTRRVGHVGYKHICIGGTHDGT